MKLLVRNLARTTTEKELRLLFEAYGTVQSCTLVTDKTTGGSKGFGFVEMPAPGESKAAMKNLNGKDVAGNKIRVKKAQQKPDSNSGNRGRQQADSPDTKLFNLEVFFNTIFQPQSGDKVAVMCDLPHTGSIPDNEQWKARREMAAEWVSKLSTLPSLQHIEVRPLVTHLATKGDNQDLPEMCRMGETDLSIRDLIKDNTIVIAMSENSATAPLCLYMKEFDHFRWASMPGVEKRMEETALSADYQKIHKRCLLLAPLFEKAVGVRVNFSTGHQCYFDITGPAEVGLDHGLLGPEVAGTPTAGSNLPAGETYTVPNEAANSKTTGTLPVMEGEELILLDVRHNKIIGVQGSGAGAVYLRGKFANDDAWANIAEVAIGVNDRAVITGNVLEDEKAGFHWAYGRSDHLEGTVGVADFNSPDNVIHQDIVYAKESPITAAKVEFVFADDTTKVVIVDGELMF